VATYTLFGQPAAPASLAGDNAFYTFDVEFFVSQSATLSAIWFYSAPGAGTLPTEIALYTVSGGTLIHSEAATWSGAMGSGWVRAAFASPPSLSPSTAYAGAILAGGDNFYSATPHYWDSGAGASGVTNGPLSAPNNAGAASGQDSFNVGSSLAFPTTSYNATNYWVDVEVTTSGSGAAVSGAVATLALVAPVGTATGGATVAGAVAALALTAPVGSVSAVGAVVQGSAATVALAAPAGTVHVGGSTVLCQVVDSGSMATVQIQAALINDRNGFGTPPKWIQCLQVQTDPLNPGQYLLVGWLRVPPFYIYAGPHP
jgi:hypothetical protein